MSSTTLTEREEPAAFAHHSIPRRTSRLPRKLRFPILLALNFCINSSLWSVAEKFLPAELGAVSKNEDDIYHVLARLAYRIGFLYFTWRANYDWVDVSALTTLTTVPYAYVLATYYAVSKQTVAVLTTIEVLSIAFPTLLLRPLSPYHKPNAPVQTRFLIESFQVQVSTALLAIGVYVVVLWVAIRSSLLNTFLVSHFDIPTLEESHTETPLSLAVKLAPAGLAARSFLLNPSFGAQSGARTPTRAFDPATATLSETLRYNFWFFTKRTRTLIKQTAVISAFMLVNTALRTLTLQGSDAVGATGYAAGWVLATVVTAAWWLWVGDTED
ncbi:uncharacterized protein EI97DRAFT_459880 [Westerdykella ornata]|uniref:Uncharacterized protein n=1 Tax=Westerdykella ornata TaxID=318751 RepID=A0A6A6JF42_WESOR|nr:uncharacterized protein EI97DRAFT_459880 [Westerdykella ornata]KAF2274927.1 hypothetical protein EI97DRAFT_459880 [Westerdykella ornata]